MNVIPSFGGADGEMSPCPVDWGTVRSRAIRATRSQLAAFEAAGPGGVVYQDRHGNVLAIKSTIPRKSVIPESG